MLGALGWQYAEKAAFPKNALGGLTTEMIVVAQVIVPGVVVKISLFIFTTTICAEVLIFLINVMRGAELALIKSQRIAHIQQTQNRNHPQQLAVAVQHALAARRVAVMVNVKSPVVRQKPVAAAVLHVAAAKCAAMMVSVKIVVKS